MAPCGSSQALRRSVFFFFFVLFWLRGLDGLGY